MDVDPRQELDPRVVRSREIFMQTVLTLLRERGHDAENLTISEITTRAGLSRPTFYQHYASPEQLIAEAVRQELEARLQLGVEKWHSDQEPIESNAPATLVELLSETNRHRWLYRPLVQGAGQFGSGKQAVADRLTAYFSPLGLGDDVSRFLAGGVLAMLGTWMTDVDPATPDEVRAEADLIWAPIQRLILSYRASQADSEQLPQRTVTR